MYLEGVNRGVSFTKAGLYTTLLVVSLGFLATSSGYNGLFLALGFGLSFLVISGLLSERTIRCTQFDGMTEAVADDSTPFSVTLKVSNTSRSWSVFGLENLITRDLPKFKLWKPHVASLIEARLLVLSPGQRAVVPARCPGLPRGAYRDFFITQRTLFPFGLISKFKVARFRTHIIVLPRRDPRLEALLTYEIRNKLCSLAQEQEFHSHTRMTAHTPWHALDWKKNASLHDEDWVMKTYESPASDLGFWIDPNWGEILHCRDREQFEGVLSSIRTAAEVIHRTARPFLVRTASGRYLDGWEAAQLYLVDIPVYAHRERIRRDNHGGQPRPGRYFRIRLSPGLHRWDSLPVSLPTGH